MLLSFYHKSQQKSKEQEAAQNKVALRIVRKCLKIQVSWANFLQYKTEGLSYRIKMYGLAFFCLLSGGYSIYLVIQSFTSHPQEIILFTPLKFFVPISQSKIENLSQSAIISTEEFRKLQLLRYWQDSLAKKPSGEKMQSAFSSPVPN